MQHRDKITIQKVIAEMKINKPDLADNIKN